MRTVAVLAMPDVIVFDLATPLEVFGRARLPDGRPAYRLIVCGTGKSVGTGALRLEVDHGLDALAAADTVIVPGISSLDADVPSSLLDALRAASRAGTRIASICVGAFVLARAGLLDGMRATTHWAAADELSARFPAIEVDPDVLYVDNGQIVTSAGAVAGVDMCLHMVRTDYGAAVAADAARLCVAPLFRDGGQAQYIMPGRPGTATATSIRPVQRWIEQNLHRELTLSRIAEAANLSVRTLNRRFQQETGQSPMQWVSKARLRNAQELLAATDTDITTIARKVGIPSTTNFRTLFKRAAGVSPSAYRATFRG